MRFVRAATAACVVLLAVSAAAAQTGGIKVIVMDQDGLPLPGATVTISHETGSVKTTTELTNKDGLVDFPVLRPGSGYSIQVEFPGFSPIRYDDLRVQLSRTLPLQIQMIEEFEERVKVIAEAEMVDLDKSEQSTRFSDEFIADLPVPGRFYQNVLTMAPGVQDADGDGNPNVHGSRSRDFQAVVGNVSNVDPLTGQWLSRINTNSIEEMEVITAGAGVEFGRAQGGFARIIQKQGSNTHEGIAELYYRTYKLDGNGANKENDVSTPEFESWQPSFQFSGPIIKDKVWYRASYELIDDENPVNVLTGIETNTVERETQDVQVTWQASPRNKVAFQFRADPAEAENVGISSRVPPASSRSFDRDVETWTLNWTAPYSPKVLVETTLAWQDINNKTSPTQSGLKNDCVPNAAQPFLSEAYCVDATRNTVSGSFFREEDDHRQRFTVKGQATVYGGRFWGMSHQFKLGINVENERYNRWLRESPFINYQEIQLGEDDESGSQVPDEGGGSLETFGRVLSRLSVPPEDEVTATGTNWALYAEDQFKPTQNLTITLGGRVDREELDSGGRSPFDPQRELASFVEWVEGATTAQGQAERRNLYYDFCSQPGAPENCQNFTGYEDMDAFEAQLQDILCAGLTGNELQNCEIDVASTVLTGLSDPLVERRRAENINITNTNFSPFISLAWSPWANGKTAFKASAGRYYNNLPLLIPLQELEPVRTVVEYRASLTPPEACDPDEDNPDAPVQCGQTKILGGIEPLITLLTVDRDLKTPYQDEFTLKFERELWAETSVSVTYINRQYEDQIQDVNINLASGDLGRCLRQNNADNPVITESPGMSLGVCSDSLAPCDTTDPNSCPSGETCGFDYYFVDANDFCARTGTCRPAAFAASQWAGYCNAGDPYCGTPYPDTNPGKGDGFIDPATGSADDNCVGEFYTNNQGGDDACGPSDPFCDLVDLLRRPDEKTDLYLQNPFWGDVFLIGNNNSIEYEAFVLELIRRQYRSWEMNASYTWSEAKGDGEDFFQELGDDPTLRANQFGFQSYDQTHVVKLNGTTITPWGVRLGTSVSWQSGLPYSLLIEQFSFDTKPPIIDFAGPDASRPRQTYPTGVRNDQRNDSFWNVDLKATKELNLAKGMNLQLSAEVFNVFDDDTYTVYNGALQRGVQINGRNEAYRRFGRRWQVGMKLAF
jgi:outer membrane receptor protein involved in Fe transport